MGNTSPSFRNGNIQSFYFEGTQLGCESEDSTYPKAVILILGATFKSKRRVRSTYTQKHPHPGVSSEMTGYQELSGSLPTELVSSPCSMNTKTRVPEDSSRAEETHTYTCAHAQ